MAKNSMADHSARTAETGKGQFWYGTSCCANPRRLQKIDPLPVAERAPFLLHQRALCTPKAALCHIPMHRYCRPPHLLRARRSVKYVALQVFLRCHDLGRKALGGMPRVVRLYRLIPVPVTLNADCASCIGQSRRVQHVNVLKFHDQPGFFIPPPHDDARLRWRCRWISPTCIITDLRIWSRPSANAKSSPFPQLLELTSRWLAGDVSDASLLRGATPLRRLLPASHKWIHKPDGSDEP